jgi:hypothetical protein
LRYIDLLFVYVMFPYSTSGVSGSEGVTGVSGSTGMRV